MAIKNKDGTVFRLNGPNKLGKTQSEIDLKKLRFHNFEWDEISTANKGAAVVRKNSDFGNVKFGNTLVVDTPEKVVSIPEPEIEVEVPDIEVEVPDVKTDFVAIKEEVAPRYDIPHLKHKTMFHCLPAMAKTSHADDLYGESWTRLKYGEKFIFPGVTMTKDDLYIEFWTTDPNRQVTERSVIYPFAYETWDTDTKRYHRVPYTEYRWWRVTELHEKDGGYVFYAVPSEFQPDFSDPS